MSKTVIKKKNTNNKKKKSKKNGFTLVELLAVLGILAIILLIGVPVFLNLRDSVLTSERENVISYIETRAADYANDTSITVVSVEDLIKEGYVEPDDETDIYDPVTNESFNCYIVTSVFENGAYESTMSEESIGTSEDGTCNSYESQVDLAICKYNDDMSQCDLINNDSWFREDVTLGVRYRNGEILNDSAITYDWLGSDGSTSSEYYISTNTNLISQNTYRVRIIADNKTSETTQVVSIDKQAPAVISATVYPDSTSWAKEKNVTIELTDYMGSGVAGIYVGDSSVCNDSLTFNNNLKDNVYTGPIGSGTHYVCVIDKVGNISGEPYEIVAGDVDDTGADWIELKANTTEYTGSVNLIGTAQDTKSGLVAYQFTQSATEPNSGWTSITQTNEQITQYKNGITSNGTWYFWVKDALGNTSSKSYRISNIDKGAPSATLTPSTREYVTSLTLTGVGTDSLSGIKRYVITTSPSKPSSGWTTLSTPQARIETEYNVTRNGTYYLHVEDAAGNSAMASYRVTNIATLKTTTMRLTTEPEESDRISDYINLPGIKELVDVEIISGGGYVSDSYLSGSRVYVSVRGGDEYRDTCWDEDRYRGEEVCEYYCDRGGDGPYDGICYYEREKEIDGYCYCDAWGDERDCTSNADHWEDLGWDCTDGETDESCSYEGQRIDYYATCWKEEEYDAEEECWYECDWGDGDPDRNGYCYHEYEYTCYYYDYRVRISYYYSEN